ncbi:MAG: ABC transporter ATP-binding protein [Acidobacteriota bacterium]
MTDRLELQAISKRYPGVLANDRVSLKVRAGEIHAILGENGAGKSTLMKIIFGAVKPDSGQILFNGKPVKIRSPQEAREMGISMVFQHFSLFDTLTVAENVWLGLDKHVSLNHIIEQIRTLAVDYGLEIDPLRPVHSLTVGERQRVEIVRALLTQPQLLILDEPTSVLTPQAVDKLFVTLRQLASRGCAILYISHKLDEIRALCHHCTVMRAGQVAGEVDPTQETNASLSRLMIGKEPPELQRTAAALGDVALAVKRLNVVRQDPFGVSLQDINLTLRAGEILGIAGVSGNGQQALMAVLSGEDPRADPGSVMLFEHDIARTSPRLRRHLGLHSVPEERLGRGAVPNLSLAQNTLLTRTDAIGPGGWLRVKGMVGMTLELIDRFKVKASGPDAVAKSLSGGNLQKFIMGREIDAEPRVLLVSQPTWGVDVGAAAQIRAELLKLRDAGCAILVVSEELEELFEISDRLMVMAKGRLSPSVPIEHASVDQIGIWMSGLWDESTEAAHVQA